MYNSPLVHWESSGATGVVNASYLSGHACEISAGGFISQTLQVVLRAGNAYSIKFSATGSGTLVIGTLSFPFEGSFETTFRPNEDATVLKITATGSLTIGDIMLVPGEISVEWSRSPLDNQADRVYYQSLKYLADAIGRGDTVINGGLILSNLIGLGNADGSGEINSGISGIKNVDSDVAFWAGSNYEKAQQTAVKFISTPSSEVASDDAKAVITHGGTAILNDVIVHGKVYASEGEFSGKVVSASGNIGGFDIEKTRLYAYTPMYDENNKPVGTAYGMWLTSLGFSLSGGGNSGFTNRYDVRNIPSPSGGFMYTMVDADINYIGREPTQQAVGMNISVEGETSTNTALKLSASGNASDAQKNIALQIDNGYVSGFRPKTVFASSSPYTCDEFDSVVAINSGTIYLYDNPENGQMLLIWHLSTTSLTINGSGHTIVRMNGGSGATAPSTNQECILLTYDGQNNVWYLAYFG